MAVMIPARNSDFGACRALILDPHLNSRRLLHDILADLHCGRVTGVGQADDAWEALEKGGYNVFFIDWSNNLDAIELLHMLRSPECVERYVPTVVLASYNGIEDVVRARDAGANEFILRPFSADVIARHLRGLSRAPRRFIESSDFFGPDRRRHRLDWKGLERRRQGPDRRADRRSLSDPTYSGPERRLTPTSIIAPLPHGEGVPMSQEQGATWH
ncbi:MAG TPA: response regulator [Magnetospirillum sp.]|jgi:CheY-like chemotaxis protein|nr:response regulator [Magnetospirillum sp.]